MSNRNSSTEWNVKVCLTFILNEDSLEKKKSMTKGTVKTGYVQYCIWSPFHVQCKTSWEPLIYVIEILGLCIPALQQWFGHHHLTIQCFWFEATYFNKSNKKRLNILYQKCNSTTIITTAGRYCLLKNISSKSGLSWDSYFNDYVTKQIPQFT